MNKNLGSILLILVLCALLTFISLIAVSILHTNAWSVECAKKGGTRMQTGDGKFCIRDPQFIPIAVPLFG